MTTKKPVAGLNASAVSDWVFDLDNTIYPAKSNLFSRVAERMTLFIMAHFDIDQEAATQMRAQLFRSYGTTMRGLMVEHDMEPEEFLSYVHEIDLSDVVADAELDRLIGRLSGRKLIYTNGTVRHATRILEALGIRRHFEFIFDIVASNHIPKPDPQPYDLFVQQSGIVSETAVMIEDMAHNLEPAANLGMQTVWLVSDHDWVANGAGGDFIHFISADLKQCLADLN